MTQSHGVVLGRFQPPHLDHLRYILEASQHCDHLIVGLTNPDPRATDFDSADAHRSDPASNPLTYWERHLILTRTLQHSLGRSRFSIVPLPINYPQAVPHYVPHGARFFLTIYDEWGRRKLAKLRALQFEVSVLWELPSTQKGISGTDVRRRMAEGQPWEHLLPPEAVRTIKDLQLDLRIREVLTRTPHLRSL